VGKVPHGGVVAGSLVTFFERTGRSYFASAADGLDIRVESTIPHGQGVSSSAAIEVATLRALDALFASADGSRLDPVVLAHTAQRAENVVVGAPCGLMDQLTSSVAPPGTLLPIRCRPDACLAPVQLPAGVCVVGWPSGVKHDVGASPYGRARTAAFMAKRIVESLGLHLPTAEARAAAEALGGGVGVVGGARLGYLAELALGDVRRRILPHVPRSITGAAFLERFGGVEDALSVVEPEYEYAIHASLEFVAGEDARVQTAVELLRTALALEAQRETALARAGQLMLEGHAAYSSIGLGAPETDRMVEAVAALGPARGFYGARVSGGGSGGTVVVLCRADALDTLRALAARPEFRFDPLFEPRLIQ
jgi:galactokinase